MILISGSSGFIGQSLLSNLNDSEGISLRENGWERKIQINNPEVIINLIGKAHDHNGIATEDEYNYANVELTKEIFHEFTSSSAKLLIHISSLAAIEEFESKIPLIENATCRPSSMYGKSKCLAEKWLLSQKLPDGKKVIILRPPMVHGPGDKGNLMLLYRLISKGIPYPLSSFDNKRSFICIDNFSFFIDRIISNYASIESGLYHIADDEALSTKDIIATIQNTTGKRTINIAIPKILIKFLAKIGDIIPFPLNTKRLKKMTSDLLVSNKKIKVALGIEKLPLTARKGLEKTILSFINS